MPSSRVGKHLSYILLLHPADGSSPRPLYRYQDLLQAGMCNNSTIEVRYCLRGGASNAEGVYIYTISLYFASCANILHVQLVPRRNGGPNHRSQSGRPNTNAGRAANGARPAKGLQRIAPRRLRESLAKETTQTAPSAPCNQDLAATNSRPAHFDTRLRPKPPTQLTPKPVRSRAMGWM